MGCAGLAGVTLIRVRNDGGRRGMHGGGGMERDKEKPPDTRKPALGGLLVGSISSCDEPEPVFGGYTGT